MPGPLTCDHWLVSVHLSQLLVTLPTRLAVLVGRKIVWLAPALTTGDEAPEEFASNAAKMLPFQAALL